MRMSESHPPPPLPPPQPTVLTVEDLNQLLLFQGETLSINTLVQASRARRGNCLEACRAIASTALDFQPL